MARTVKDIVDMKKNGKKISVLTSYDYALASLCDKAGVDILLVGDSAGMVVLGYDDTLQVTMEQMEIFVGAVSRAKQNALVVGDLPFMSYQASITDAIANSGRLIKYRLCTIFPQNFENVSFSYITGVEDVYLNFCINYSS